MWLGFESARWLVKPYRYDCCLLSDVIVVLTYPIGFVLLSQLVNSLKLINKLALLILVVGNRYALLDYACN